MGEPSQREWAGTPRGPIEHELKTLAPFFWAAQRGEKTFEIRKHDRDFRVGDTLVLVEWDGAAAVGGRLKRKITYITTAYGLGLLVDGVSVLGLATVAADEQRQHDRFEAAVAMHAAFIANTAIDGTPDAMAESAVRNADALLSELDKEPG